MIVKLTNLKKCSNTQQATSILQTRGFTSGYKQWICGNMIGTGLGIAVGLVGATRLLSAPVDLLLWGVTGVTVGITQAQALQHKLNAKGWIWASLMGWMLGGFVAGRGGVNWGIIGSIVGVMQWLVLRRHIDRAGWWVVVNAAGLIFGASFGWSLRFTSRWSFLKQGAAIDDRILEAVDWVVAGLAGGAVSGAITGLWLMGALMLKQHKPDETSNVNTEVNQ